MRPAGRSTRSGREKQLHLSSEGREEVKETKLKNGEAGRRRAGGEVRGSREVMGKGQERGRNGEETVIFIIYCELGVGTKQLQHRFQKQAYSETILPCSTHKNSVLSP